MCFHFNTYSPCTHSHTQYRLLFRRVTSLHTDKQPKNVHPAGARPLYGTLHHLPTGTSTFLFSLPSTGSPPFPSTRLPALHTWSRFTHSAANMFHVKGTSICRGQSGGLLTPLNYVGKQNTSIYVLETLLRRTVWRHYYPFHSSTLNDSPATILTFKFLPTCTMQSEKHTTSSPRPLFVPNPIFSLTHKCLTLVSSNLIIFFPSITFLSSVVIHLSLHPLIIVIYLLPFTL